MRPEAAQNRRPFPPRLRRPVLLVGLTASVFLAVAVYSGLPELIAALARFPWAWLPALLLITSAGYVLRLLRWLYYLKLSNVSSSLRQSTVVFFAGLSLSITPGKLGEIAKAYFLKEIAGVPVAQSTSAVLMERIMDLVSMALLGLLMAVLLLFSWAALLIGVPVLLGAILLILPWCLQSLLRLPLTMKLPIIRRYEPFLLELRAHLLRLSMPGPLLIGIILSTLAWGGEGVAFWLVLDKLNTGVPLEQAIAIYAVSAIIGAVTLVPGGLGITETSLIGLLRALNIARAPSATGTVIIRMCTLWFGVVVGLLSLQFLLHFRSTSTPPGPPSERP